MQQISVVIICRNEADEIGNTLSSLAGLTDDVVVYDNGSTDDTVNIARLGNAKVYMGEWKGFGPTKMEANRLAKYDWVLSLDADESIDEDLKKVLLSMKFGEEKIAYRLPFRNFLGSKPLRFGEWGNDSHIRLFNRQQVQWSNDAVHETLIFSESTKVKRLSGGFILHRTVKDLSDYTQKVVKYALLSAEKYYRNGKKASWFKIMLAPMFNFFNYYILKLGFLDGHAGYVCAKMTAHYTFLKYSRLRELYGQATVQEQE